MTSLAVMGKGLNVRGVAAPAQDQHKKRNDGSAERRSAPEVGHRPRHRSRDRCRGRGHRLPQPQLGDRIDQRRRRRDVRGEEANRAARLLGRRRRFLLIPPPTRPAAAALMPRRDASTIAARLIRPRQRHHPARMPGQDDVQPNTLKEDEAPAEGAHGEVSLASRQPPARFRFFASGRHMSWQTRKYIRHPGDSFRTYPKSAKPLGGRDDFGMILSACQ